MLILIDTAERSKASSIRRRLGTPPQSNLVEVQTTINKTKPKEDADNTVLTVTANIELSRVPNRLEN